MKRIKSKKSPYEFPPSTRKLIYERDNYRCVIPGCHNTFGLGIMHVFVSRAKGGMGVKQNGALGCQVHHHTIDNGRCGVEAERLHNMAKDYLIGHYGDITKESVIYNKWR